MAKTALCADESCLRDASLLGLQAEILEMQPWLACFCDAAEARDAIGGNAELEEAWVAGSNQMEAINLAACLKRDRPDLRVCLVTGEESGSLRSRAHLADLDAVFSEGLFVNRYALVKRHLAEGFAGQKGESKPQQSAGLKDEVDGEGRTIPFGHSAGSPLAQLQRDIPRQDGPVRNAPPTISSLRPASHQLRDERNGFLLSVVSGSGGAGKSTIAALSALYAQQRGYRTLLLDFDLQFGDIRELLGLQQAVSVDELVATPELIERLRPHDGKPAVLAAPARIELAEALLQSLPEVLDELLSRFEVVVANTGASWDESHAVLLERSSKVIFLIDQHASSLRACRHALELCSSCGIATGPFLFAVNKCTKNGLFTSIDVSCALQGAPAVEFRDGGRDVVDCAGSGQIADLLSVKNDLSMSLVPVLEDVLPGCRDRASDVSQQDGTAQLAKRSSLFRSRKRRMTA